MLWTNVSDAQMLPDANFGSNSLITQCLRWLPKSLVIIRVISLMESLPAESSMLSCPTVFLLQLSPRTPDSIKASWKCVSLNWIRFFKQSWPLLYSAHVCAHETHFALRRSEIYFALNRTQTKQVGVWCFSPQSFSLKGFMLSGDIHLLWNCLWRGWTHDDTWMETQTEPCNEYKLLLLGYSWSS